MVVIGNPPYNVSSANKGNWILDLIADYKKNLNERKINLDDDYIKFIRYGQYYIDKMKLEFWHISQTTALSMGLPIVKCGKTC